MKKTLFLLYAALFMMVSAVKANPVDLSLAQTAASKFMGAKFNVELRNSTPEMVYAEPNGAFYVFNYGTQGFVIIAADDAYRPVIGYSNESAFDANNIPPALADHLDGIAMSINRLRGNGNAVATPLVAADWESLLTSGELISRNGGRGVDYLCQTKWNQTYPYNYCCPDDPAGSGGHAIVGCLATAMSQLMRFWASPIQGVGSHCYYHEDYGEICADFGNTVYDWDHMPNVLNSNSSDEEKLATGTLCFHCGVTIDMGYGPDGSGGASGPIPAAMHNYFNYCDAIVQLRRNDYELEKWKTMVREQFDMGWPMYYGGCQDGGCHAFVCDGYDDNDMFHFNLGWGGGSDGWYIIDEAPYTHPADAMFNFVPAEVYNMTPSAPVGLTVTPASDTELKTTLSWTNPSTTLNGTALSSIEEVVVLRNNAIICTLTDVAPGAVSEIVDAEVPCYDSYHYAVYVKAGGRYGKHADVNVLVGPTCTWKLIMSSTNNQGWNGGYITAYNNAGHEVGRFTINSSTSTMFQPALPLGTLSFGWTAPEEAVDNMVFVIKDSDENALYSFSGSSDELASGIFLVTNNGCGNDMNCDVPENVVASSDGGHILVTWDAVDAASYGYNIYRDGMLCRLVQSGSSFFDEQAALGGHCYQVTALCEGGESQYSNVTCASDGPCYPPRDLDYELTSNFKIKLSWKAPAVTEGFTGYYLFRKAGDGEYKRIKLMGPTALTYTDNSFMEEGDYYYRLYAYYQHLGCLSAPANRKYETNVFELHAYYSPTGLNEVASELTIAPNPTEGTVTIICADMQEVVVYDVVGQLVMKEKAEGEKLTIDLGDLPAGLYFVNVFDQNGGCCVRKLVKQ
ncbi:MAG: thiol protease/hemagglutinin PrtT [Bacteroidales bacterium]|nr:thiol protease/hemagglutinin PrtT [Bacteroidales bacterium]